MGLTAAELRDTKPTVRRKRKKTKSTRNWRKAFRKKHGMCYETWRRQAIRKGTWKHNKPRGQQYAL